MRFSASRLACSTSFQMALSLMSRSGRTQHNEFHHGKLELLRPGKTILSLAVMLLAFVGVAVQSGAQDMSTGALNVTVTDSGGALIPGAKLVLKDLGTNDVHAVTTKDNGTIVIPFLNPAVYSLTVSKTGFASNQYAQVTITTNQVTNLAVALKVGATTDTVTVTSDRSPILDTTSNTLSTNIDMKQVQDLPTGARDVSSLAFLVPGAVDDNINNLPGGAENVSANGFSTVINRNKSGGFDSNNTRTVQRLESTQEMTVETGELDASKGGTAAMDIGFLTQRGTNRFHGQLFWDYRSEAMNANSWARNFAHQPRGLLIINDFGASVGGPLWKDKLFFFASLGNYRRPFQNLVTTSIPTPLALSGVYTYFPCQNANATPTNCKTSSSVTATENVLQIGASAGCPTCTSTINSVVAADLANIQQAIAMSGVTVTAGSDVNHENINFSNHGSTIQRFPTLRIDYNVTPNFRLTGTAVGTFTYNNHSGNPPYPGLAFAADATSSKNRSYQAVAGFDWTIRPNIVNAFRVGYLYTFGEYSSQGLGAPTPAMTAAGDLIAGFGFNTGINGFLNLHGGSLYPVRSLKDDTTWSHGKHTISFGVELSTEVDHYYNNQFVPYIYINGIADGDPVLGALDNSAAVSNGPTSDQGDVENLYALLNGRVNDYSLGQFVNSKTKQFQPGISFNLHEKLTQVALFAQDSWKATPTLTLNAGLRWDFSGASTDETGFYTHPSISDLWGPSGQGNLFKPGTLAGNFNAVEGPAAQAYAPTYIHPQPSVGFAWNPHHDSDTVIGKIFGNGKSVIRGSFTLKNYTEGAQNFWNFGSNNGSNFNTYFTTGAVAPTPGVTPGPGFFNAGSYVLGMSTPATVSSSPIPYQSVITESSLALQGDTIATFDPHIKQPYLESWQFGIQRQLTANNVIEVRYVGNVSKDQWLVKNYNEVNIFENGFLNEFEAAQANLAASGGTTFKGANPTPIMDQAFKTSGAGAYKNSTFIKDLQQGQAGAMANSLAGNATYLCSLTGANFPQCGAQGFAGTGNYPINFFQANPYMAGGSILEMGNYGFSNYNALQVDFRQNTNHGMQFDVNYTFSKGLGTTVQGSTAPGYYGGRSNSAGGFFTLRNQGLNYFPSAFDVRHVMHASGTYDLPFGHGRMFFNQNPVANAVVGGWTIGTIVTWESGEPHLLSGGTATFNGGGNSGVELIGVTASQLQHSMQRHNVPGKGYVEMLDSKYLQANGSANPAYITPEYTAGKIGNLVWLHSPTNFNTDFALNKVVPIYRDQVNLKLQGVFLNAFNHVSWTGMQTSIQSTTFGTTSTVFGSGARQIEVRANLTF